MKKQMMPLVITLGISISLSGCSQQQVEGSPPDDSLREASTVKDDRSPSPFVEREFWLALAEEPGWHLNLARDLFLNGETAQASVELGKVAAILNFESRHSHSPKERGMLFASVQELREVAKELRYQAVPFEGLHSVEELDRVAALAFRTIAAHQVALAREALEAGDARMAGRYISETAKALEDGFKWGGIEPGRTVHADLAHASEMASRMELLGEGSHEEGLTVLQNLDSKVEELGDVLTSRRR